MNYILKFQNILILNMRSNNLQLLLFIVILLESSLYITFTLAADTNSKEKLLLVVEISRHGARSPNKIFPLAMNEEDNFKNKSELL